MGNDMRFTKAADVMSESVVSLRPEMSLKEAWEVLYENHISGAPVVDEQGNVLGVLSQSDLVRELAAETSYTAPFAGFYYDVPCYFPFGDSKEHKLNELAAITVSEAMTVDPVCVRPSDSISYLAGTMRSRHIHRLIVTEGKKLCGIVSSLDLLKAMAI